MKLACDFCLAMTGFWNRRFVVALASFLLAMLFMLAFYLGLVYGLRFTGSSILSFDGGNMTVSTPHRKLIRRASTMEETNRIWGEKCTKADIVINQGPTAPLPNGIPTYTVEITNVCVTGCDISGIHLSCGWFSSARLINPRIFKRLRYDDCLVNNGKPLINGGALSFQYANTFSYPLSVSSVICS